MNPIAAAIQMTSTLDVDDNLNMAKNLLEQAADKGATLAVLPEMFPLIGIADHTHDIRKKIKEEKGHGKIQDFLSQTAKRLNMWIVGGTIPLNSNDPQKNYASCLVFNNQGDNIAHYDKIHLFDATLSDAELYRESHTTIPGKEIVVIDTPIGRAGLSVCYDMRFPELYRKMLQEGAEIFIIPAAFAVTTGKAHWEILLRARAIENFCYVIASAQWGNHPGRETYGHSMIVAPSGSILTELNNGIGIVIAEIDLNFLKEQRQKIPAGEHRRFFS